MLSFEFLSFLEEEVHFPTLPPRILETTVVTVSLMKVEASMPMLPIFKAQLLEGLSQVMEKQKRTSP